MAPDFRDMAAPGRRRAVALMPAMLAIVRELGPVDHLEALYRLKVQGRVKPGARASVAYLACVLLETEGLLERTDGRWRVPSDSAVIIRGHGHDDAAVASPLAARAG